MTAPCVHSTLPILKNELQSTLFLKQISNQNNDQSSTMASTDLTKAEVRELRIGKSFVNRPYELKYCKSEN